MAKRRNRNEKIPAAVLGAARDHVAAIVTDMDTAMAVMVDETPVAVVDVYDPMAPVAGAPDLAAAISASAAAIAAARTTPTVTVTVVHPRRNAPGVPDGLHAPGTWISVPGIGDAEIRGIHHRIEYDDRAPQWGNVSGTMWTAANGTAEIMVGSAPVYPIGSRGTSSRGRTGTVRETFYVVRDKNKTMHNVGWTRVSRTRPASGPYGMVYADVIPTPSTPAPTVRAVDGTV